MASVTCRSILQGFSDRCQQYKCLPASLPMTGAPMSVEKSAGPLVSESPSELYHEASKLRESDRATAQTVWSVNTSPQIRQVIANPAVSHRGYPNLKLPIDF